MSLALRSSLVVLALAAAALSTYFHSSRARELTEIEQAFAEVAPTADVARRLDRVLQESDPARRRVEASRELVAGVIRSLPPESMEQRLHLVAAAERSRELTLRALEERPADADASALLGAATYLARTLDRDRRLFTESEAWEEPLEHAMELAPGSNLASEFLAMAYLDVWGLLSEEKREITVGLLRDGFHDPQTFRRLMPPWLVLAPDLETALSVVPDDPLAWSSLSQILARGQRYDDLLIVEELRRTKLLEDLERTLLEAERNLEGGHAHPARLLLLGVLEEAEVDGLFAPAVERALRSLPPGPVGKPTAERLREWLDWTLELCLLEPCPFTPEVIARLEVLSANEDVARRAATALAAGDLVEGERLLRLQPAGTARGPEWGLSRIFAARLYRQRQDLTAAERELDALHRDWQDHPVARRERTRLAADRAGPERRRPTPSGNETEASRATSRGQTWESWRWSRSDAESSLFLEVRATGQLSFEAIAEQDQPSILLLAVDGEPPTLHRADAGALVETATVLTPGLHLLRVNRIAGREVRPGDVTVAP